MDLKKIIADYEEILQNVKKSLSGAPEGFLRISKDKVCVRYYILDESSGPNGRYTTAHDPKSLEKIKALAQKKYDMQIKQTIEKDLVILKKANLVIKENKVANLFYSLPKERQNLIEPYQISDEKFAALWKSESFIQKNVNESENYFLTDCGEKVRSKSEYIIANKLTALGIPFKYEMRYEMKHRNFGTNNVTTLNIFPDFTVLNKRTRQVYIFEHFGLMSDEKYQTNFANKIELYEENGFSFGKSFVFTCETAGHGLNLDNLERIIRNYFL